MLRVRFRHIDNLTPHAAVRILVFPQSRQVLNVTIDQSVPQFALVRYQRLSESKCRETVAAPPEKGDDTQCQKRSFGCSK